MSVQAAVRCTTKIHFSIRDTQSIWVLNVIIARIDGRVKKKMESRVYLRSEFSSSFFCSHVHYHHTGIYLKKKTHIYTFHKDLFTMQVLFYDNLTLNVSGIPMDQNKQQQSKFIHFLEPDFITSNTS